MKNLIAGCAVAAALISCNNTHKENTANGQTVLLPSANALGKSISGEDHASNSYPYKALDGSRAKVSFNNSDKNATLTVEANGKTFQLDKKSSGNYERNGITAVAKGDSVILSQGGNTIPLVIDK